MATPLVQSFYHADTDTITHVVYDKPGGKAAIIDAVLDYDPNAGRTSTESADILIAFLFEHRLDPAYILETHVHADHLSAAHYLREQLGAAIGIGDQVGSVIDHWAKVFNMDREDQALTTAFDLMLKDGDTLPLGDLTIEILATPGHTATDITFVIGDAAFIGDTMFMPDYGTARTDFPGGNAKVLYQSIKKILSLPAETRLFMCHDYQPGGRDPAWLTSVAEQKAQNIHLSEIQGEKDFVTLREGRDANLAAPRLILPSLQVNIRGGALPAPEENGSTYIKIPINLL